MNTKKRLEDYSWDELLEATSGKEGMKEAGRNSAEYTLENNLGIHTNDEELRRQWAIMGGEASIDKLHKWQQENNHLEKLQKKERTDSWKQNQSIGLKKYYEQNPMPIEIRTQIGNTIKEINSKLSDEQLSKKYSNKKPNLKHFELRKTILDSIPTDTFNTSDARLACEQYGLKNWKGFLKDTRIVVQLHKGTNKLNPSIYKKV